MVKFKKGELIEKFQGNSGRVKLNVPYTFRGYNRDGTELYLVGQGNVLFNVENFRKWVEVKREDVKSKIKEEQIEVDKCKLEQIEKIDYKLSSLDHSITEDNRLMDLIFKAKFCN